MTRTAAYGIAAAVVLALGAGGWAAASATSPVRKPPRADGLGLRVRYEVVRAPPYTPPPISELTRLEVLSAGSPTRVEEGVLSAQAGEALRSLQAQDAGQAAAALAQIRAEDARIDRETAAALVDARAASDAPAAAPASES